MKLFKNIMLPFFGMIGLMLMFLACNRDNVKDDTVFEPTANTELTEANPLVARSIGANGEGMDFDCFVIKYTFAFVDEDGVEYEIASDDDLISLFDSGEEVAIVDFVYPLTAANDDEDIVVNDAEDLAELFAECTPSGGWEEGDFPAFSINFENSCFELGYPVTLRDLEGNTTEVADEAALNSAIAEEPVFFVFPISLIDETGDIIEVTNIDVIFDALIGCNGFGPSTDSLTVEWDWEGGFEYLGCYMLEFPFNVNIADGSEETVNDHMELCDLMLTGEIVDYVYPLSLTDDEDNVFVISSADELDALLLECEGVWELTFEGDAFILLLGASPLDGSEPCYVIEFPIDLSNGSSTTIQDLGEFQQVVLGGLVETQNLIYPVTVTFSSGDTFVLESALDLFQIIEDCE